MPRTNLYRAVILLLLVAQASACRDAPTDPANSELRLELKRGDLPFEEETIAIGETLQLNAKLINASGVEQGASGASWSSTNQAVATVATDGKVTAAQLGSAEIVVRMGERADTGYVSVAAPVTGALECAPGDPLVSLAPGGAQVFVGDGAVNLCLPGDAAEGSDYLIVPFNASIAAAARLDVRVLASASVPSTDILPVSRSVQPMVPLQRGPQRDEFFHRQHLERSRAEFEPALRMTAGVPDVTARAVPAIGTLMNLNAGALAGSGCSDPDYRTGRVVATSQRAIIVADTMNPAGGFTASDYATIGATFDDLIWSVNTGTFGEPTDIDENERVVIFYTRAVNELTPSGADSYVGGFFYNRDLFPRKGSNACAGSNEAEMFYMLVPDPQGAVNGNARGRDFVLERTYSVLAHEFQHLINDSRRLYVNKALVWEDSWLNEGLSHIAEELAFYAASGYEPRQNLGTSPIFGAGNAAFLRYNIDNMERYIRFLREPELHSPMGDVRELATRGSAWAFLRYVADREPGDDQALWRRLSNSTSLGLQNLEEVLGVNPRSWMHDWQVSVYTDDTPLPVKEQYTQPSWNFRLLTEILNTQGEFPLETRGIGPSSPSMLLEGGGAAFLRLRVGAGGRRLIRTTVDDLPPPSRLRLAVVRTR